MDREADRRRDADERSREEASYDKRRGCLYVTPPPDEDEKILEGEEGSGGDD